MKDKLVEIKERFKKTTQGEWTAYVNYPFYIDLRKPSPSLSKHDSERPTFWSMNDGLFVLNAHNNDIPWLIEEVERLRKELELKNER